ncbi:MAG: thioredoxin-dependent thiol peroxidase [Candidatus Aenigmarchaeota archaeon]|nr:thioredoxin-dependent thiol peroxidase [Candidatus Aenigmarchaeota archaeon]
MIKAGEAAPDFALTDAEGKIVKLSDFRGQPVVLYFYPKDMTPGCTKEACGFRDYASYFGDKNVAVIGVSLDSADSHKKFATKYGLPHLLLSDPDAKVSTRYGVYQKKKLYGREFWGIVRTTFIISPEGRVQKVYEKVDVATHHRDVLRLFD